MTPDDPLEIAVLGDVHGHLTLVYQLLRRWQRETGRALDLVLQVGDLGAFPPPFRLDRATKRFAESDPDELGFAAYHEGGPEADAVLGPDVPPDQRISADLVFIRGNHEDFEFLAEAGAGYDAPVPVDAYQKILYLPNGGRFTFRRGPHRIAIGGLGGVSHQGGRAGRDPVSEHYTAGEVRKLRSRGDRIDVLLSHEPPHGAAAAIHPRYADGGSRDVLELIRDLRPTYHFAGHYHEPGQRLAAAGETRSYELNAVNFLRPHRLNPGCIGVLRWAGPDESEFAFVDAPWLDEYTRSNYRTL
ncbi:metallophosphoesterase [Sorangium sp. So ce321]|uniref:metallophosphoesterase family protein n=1 Tax=Sorangium sp. So ce321 TaxID=3133300 RepID=UPI003F5D8280